MRKLNGPAATGNRLTKPCPDPPPVCQPSGRLEAVSLLLHALHTAMCPPGNLSLSSTRSSAKALSKDAGKRRRYQRVQQARVVGKDKSGAVPFPLAGSAAVHTSVQAATGPDARACVAYHHSDFNSRIFATS